MEIFGQDAYNAYGDSVGWKNTRGEVLLEWAKLATREQLAWQSAAQVVINRTLEQPEVAKASSAKFLAPITTV